jgi:hypothetical protein
VVGGHRRGPLSSRPVDFLEAIVDNKIDDAREVLLYYSKYDDPIWAFREKHKKLMELLEAQGAAKKE